MTASTLVVMGFVGFLDFGQRFFDLSWESKENSWKYVCAEKRVSR